MYHPAVLAKHSATADQIFNGRWATSILCGGYHREDDALGIPWLNPDEPLKAQDNDSLRTTLESLTQGSDQQYTAREVIRNRCIGGLGPVLVGGPKKVADELERWVDEGGVDGFNLAYAVTPGTTTDFIDYIVPELRRRGRVQTSYTPGTLREKFIGTKDGYTEKSHPAATFRGSYAGKESVHDKTIPSKWDADTASHRVTEKV